MSSVITKTNAVETVVVGPIVDSTGAALTGLTNIKAAVIRASDKHFLDWSNHTFTATPVTEYQTLTELDSTRAPGVYYLDIDTSLFVSPVAKDKYFVYVSQQGASNAVNALQMGEFRVGTIVDAVEANLNAPVALFAGTASAGSSASITLAGGSSTDEFYRWMTVAITSGTGAGQARVVAHYVGSTKVATVHRAWTTAPDSTSVFELTASVQPELLEIGLAQAGGASTLQLLASASAVDNLYSGKSVAITAGTGAGQERSILSYVGATTTVTVDEAWTTAPDSTSVYVITFGRARVASVTSGATATIQSGMATSAALTTAQAALTSIMGSGFTGGVDDLHSLHALTAGLATASALSSLQSHGDSTWATAVPSAFLGASLSGYNTRTTWGGAVAFLRKLSSNRLEEAPGTPGTLTLYDDDGTTVLGTYQLRDAGGNAVASATGEPARRTAVSP